MPRAHDRDALRQRLYVAPSPIQGQGCFARRGFAPGDFIGVFEGHTVAQDGPHVLWLYDTETGALIGRRGENRLRWLNHSDRPNAVFDGFRLYAIRAIASDDEITIDYAGGS